MKILFVTFGELSVSGGAYRPAAMVRALADAGHQLTIAAAWTNLPDHPNLTLLCGQAETMPNARLRLAAARAAGSMKFDAVHAVDDAALFCAKICRLRKIPLIYDAVRRFSGRSGRPPSRRWKWFPGRYAAVEKKLLQTAAAVLAPDPLLQKDLAALQADARIMLIQDVPRQTLFCGRTESGEALFDRLGRAETCVAACSFQAADHAALRQLLMAVRKVIDACPKAFFVFKGAAAAEAEPMAKSLAIEKQCCFLNPEETYVFLSAVDAAGVSVFMPSTERCGMDPEILTLLYGAAPVVAVMEDAYADLLTESNSIPVLRNTDAIASGIIRALQEPLFARGLQTQGRQLIADHYSLSSFKHQVRMLYHDVLNKD